MSRHIKFGIASVPGQRARSLAIISGKRARVEGEPKIWFPLVSAAARVLSDENMGLLKAIRAQNAGSMEALVRAVGKQAPNVSRSLHTMAQYGLVKLNKIGRTVVQSCLSSWWSVLRSNWLEQKKRRHSGRRCWSSCRT